MRGALRLLMLLLVGCWTLAEAGGGHQGSSVWQGWPLRGMPIGEAGVPGPPCLDDPEVQSEEEIHEEDMYYDMATLVEPEPEIDWATWIDSERRFKLSAVPQSTAETAGRDRRATHRDSASSALLAMVVATSPRPALRARSKGCTSGTGLMVSDTTAFPTQRPPRLPRSRACTVALVCWCCTTSSTHSAVQALGHTPSVAARRTHIVGGRADYGCPADAGVRLTRARCARGPSGVAV